MMTSLQANWESLQSEMERSLFLLATFFSQGTSAPLWLLELAAGTEEREEPLELLKQAVHHLQIAGFVESATDDQLSLNPQQHQFGQDFIQAAGIEGKLVIAKAAQHLLNACWKLDALEQRALRVGYQVCKEQVQGIRLYLDRLGFNEYSEMVEQLEDWLNQESSLFISKTKETPWWLEVPPNLFYQQLHNRSVAADRPLITRKEPARWLRLIKSVGTDAFRFWRIPGDGGFVTLLPDGRLALSKRNYDDPLRIWEIKSGRELRKLEIRGSISDASVSLNGRQIFTAATFGTQPCVWEIESGRKVQQLETGDGVANVAISLNGRLVATTTYSRLIRIWNVESGRKLQQLQDDVSLFNDRIAFSPDGKLLLTFGFSHGPVSIWEVESGRKLRQLSDHSRCVVFSPDGKLIFIGLRYGGGAYLWEVERRRKSLWLSTTPWGIICAAFSPNGRLVLAGSEDGTVRLWEVESGREIRQFSHSDRVDAVAFSPDGQLALTASESGTIRSWEIEKRDECLWEKDFPKRIGQVVFSSDGKLSLTYGSSSPIILSSGGRIMLTYGPSYSNPVRLWEVESGRQQRVLRMQDVTKTSSSRSWALLPSGRQGWCIDEKVGSAAFSPDGRLVLVGYDKIALLWEVSSGRVLRQLNGHNDMIRYVAFSPSGRLMLTGSYSYTDRDVYLWEVSSGRRLHSLRHRYGVWSLAFSPDEQYVLIGGAMTASLWSVRSGRRLQFLKGHSKAMQVAFSSDGRLGIVVSQNKAQLWDIRSMREVCQLSEPIKESVVDAAFSSDGGLVLIVSMHQIVLWEVESGRVVMDHAHKDMLTRSAFSPDGRLVVVCNSSGQVYFYAARGSERGRLLGMFVAPYEVGALYWQSTNQLVVADKGGPTWRPHFSQVMLEGKWEDG